MRFHTEKSFATFTCARRSGSRPEVTLKNDSRFAPPLGVSAALQNYCLITCQFNSPSHYSFLAVFSVYADSNTASNYTRGTTCDTASDTTLATAKNTVWDTASTTTCEINSTPARCTQGTASNTPVSITLSRSSCRVRSSLLTRYYLV